MKKALFFLLIISYFSYGQTTYDTYDDLISKANTLRTDGNYKQAIDLYAKALELLTPSSSTPFFNLAECAVATNNLPLADEWIRKGVSLGGAPKSYLKAYKGFADIQEKEFYLRIVADYNTLRQEYFSNIDDIDLYLEIEELTQRDQFVRKTDVYLNGYSEIDYQNAGDGILKATKQNDTVALKHYKKIMFGQAPKEHRATTDELMRRVDSLNVARLMEITKVHGWQERAWIILWHQRGSYGEDHYVWNYFKPLIDKEIEEGKLSRTFWRPFEQFKEMEESGNFGTIQLDEQPKKEIKLKNQNIKG